MSEKLVIRGGRRLQGEVTVSGGKNAAVAIIPAALLADSPCKIDNLPDINDVHVLIDMLRWLGAKVDFADILYTSTPRKRIIRVNLIAITKRTKIRSKSIIKNAALRCSLSKTLSILWMKFKMYTLILIVRKCGLPQS